ncbi:hypothetical protein QUB05_19020 [Microcoleus sp. F10-C6]|uniref:hypothetical protein n=1 Tax=Microcoleus sp. F10-C6 TaxID=2818757 RepID=UPI002FD4122D
MAAIFGKSLILLGFFAIIFRAVFLIVFVVIAGMILLSRNPAGCEERKAESATVQPITRNVTIPAIS